MVKEDTSGATDLERETTFKSKERPFITFGGLGV